MSALIATHDRGTSRSASRHPYNMRERELGIPMDRAPDSGRRTRGVGDQSRRSDFLVSFTCAIEIIQ